MRKLILSTLVALIASFSANVTTASAAENPNKYKIDGIVVGLVQEQQAKLRDRENVKKYVEKTGGATIACTDQLWSDNTGDAVSGVFSEWGYKTRGKKPVVNVVANFAVTVCNEGSCNTTYEYVDPTNVNYVDGVLSMHNDHHFLKCQDREGGYLYQSNDRSRWFNNQGSAGQSQSEYQYRDVTIDGAWHPDLGKDVFHQQYLQVWSSDGKQSYTVLEPGAGGKD